MNKSKTNDYAKFLTILAKQASLICVDDIKRVLNNELDLKINLSPVKQVESTKKLFLDIDLEKIVNELNDINDRNVALDKLQMINKKGLEVIARSLDIAIQRTDKVEAIKNKIVESTVGARLRSSAIQGTTV
ncbi:hypothetical protein D5R81_12570 [Parashewanella spongiae]|uniref:Uncharacterized protein n=1 Tax=Parashewanella spongiae TaxID=342950 RepID=A0A3A6TJC9_9GAMM|nr:hypothetical protein [Parashewanella spongiae]MCL1078717.1 hypothetical protein [Parashewanella spongiae]RJY12288.1 hypothetical protein D5R81_12570 [Parashewanella spongiae]